MVWDFSILFLHRVFQRAVTLPCMLMCAGTYSCPCYYFPVRAGRAAQPSFVVGIELKSGAATPDHWIKRGTALLMSLDSWELQQTHFVSRQVYSFCCSSLVRCLFLNFKVHSYKNISYSVSTLFWSNHFLTYFASIFCLFTVICLMSFPFCPPSSFYPIKHT